MSLDTASDIPLAALDAARRLVPDEILSVALAGAGANSRIFRVETKTGPLALKSYPTRLGDPRDRQDCEWRALVFLRANGETAVPQALARTASGGFTMMEWIEGHPVTAPADPDVREACAFIRRVFALSSHADANGFGPASEACLSEAEIFAQIARRLDAFAPYPGLQAFLDREFGPALRAAEAQSSPGMRDAALEPAQRRLIPADFGFHNALKTAEGRLRFFDFEYFGWDDPAKLAADFMLHPAVALTEAQKQVIKKECTEAMASDPTFAERLRRRYALYRLRWVLILLNPFRRDRIASLDGDPAGLDKLFHAQRHKAQAMLGQRFPA